MISNDCQKLPKIAKNCQKLLLVASDCCTWKSSFTPLLSPRPNFSLACARQASRLLQGSRPQPPPPPSAACYKQTPFSLYRVLPEGSLSLLPPTTTPSLPLVYFRSIGNQRCWVGDRESLQPTNMTKQGWREEEDVCTRSQPLPTKERV